MQITMNATKIKMETPTKKPTKTKTQDKHATKQIKQSQYTYTQKT